MLVRFEVSWDCDLVKKTLTDKYATVSFTATDKEKGREYRQERVLDTEYDGNLTIEAYIVRVFLLAFKAYGFEQKTHEWGDAYFPTHHGEDIVNEKGEVLATTNWWRIAKKKRKRRWGEVILRGDFAWNESVGIPVFKYFNPVGDELSLLAGDCYFANSPFSSFSPENEDWTCECIARGMRVARATLDFYERMAGAFEWATGKEVSGKGQLCHAR